jgi:hypothetical protein
MIGHGRARLLHGYARLFVTGTSVADRQAPMTDNDCGYPQLLHQFAPMKMVQPEVYPHLEHGFPMKLVAWFLVLAASLANAGAQAQTQSPIVIKFSHVVASDTPKGKAAERFKQLAEKATGGRVRIDVYPNNQLYKDKEELEALQLGAVQMLAPSLAKFGPLGVREFEVFDLPYIFPTKEVLYRVTEGQIGQNLLKKLEAKGITGLAFWDNGFKVMSSNKPLRTPADFKGLKMRVQPSKVLDAQMRALGQVHKPCLSMRSTRRCRAGWSMAPKTRLPISIPSACTKCSVI